MNCWSSAAQRALDAAKPCGVIASQLGACGTSPAAGMRRRDCRERTDRAQLPASRHWPIGGMPHTAAADRGNC